MGKEANNADIIEANGSEYVRIEIFGRFALKNLERQRNMPIIDARTITESINRPKIPNEK